MSGDAARVAEQEFEALIGPLVEPGLRLAYSMLGDRAEAEDATQEAITKAWRNLSRLRDRDQARPWLLAIVANQCRNMRRTRWFPTVRLPALFQPTAAATERARIDIERALGRLSMYDRQIRFSYYSFQLPMEVLYGSLRLCQS